MVLHGVLYRSCLAFAFLRLFLSIVFLCLFLHIVLVVNGFISFTSSPLHKKSNCSLIVREIRLILYADLASCSLDEVVYSLLA